MQAGMHGTKGGLMSSIDGGSFESGFAAGAVSSLVASGIEALGGLGGYYTDDDYSNWSNFASRNPVAIKAIMIASGGLSGGFSSSIAGGSFADGFRQGVITSGLNHAMNHMAQEIKIRNVIKELEKNYPKHSKYRTNELYELIGGPLLDWYNETQTNNDPNDDLSLCNTCAVRISRALNYTKGLEIPAKPGNGIETFKGGDGLNYIINATHMAKYLTENFGKKSFYKGTEFTPRNGIIAMYSSNSKNARVNHVDLVVKGRWIGLQDMSPKFFKIWF